MVLARLRSPNCGISQRHSSSPYANFGSYPTIKEIVPLSVLQFLNGSRRTSAHFVGRKNRNCWPFREFSCLRRLREVRGSVVLVAPQGFEPFEMEQVMTNLVEDAHTSKKYLMLDFSCPPSHFLWPF